VRTAIEAISASSVGRDRPVGRRGDFVDAVAVDFGVTQVVDANWGIRAVLKKEIFDG
jgi:hypothetical protein